MDKVLLMRVGVGMIPALTLVLMSGSLKAEEWLDEAEIQTLEVIEVPGTVIMPEERDIAFAVPTVGDLVPLPSENLIHPHVEIKVAHTFTIMGIYGHRTRSDRRDPGHSLACAPSKSRTATLPSHCT